MPTQNVTEEVKSEADFTTTFANPPEPTVRNEPSMNLFWEHTSSPLSERDMLVAESVPAHVRQVNAMAGNSYG